MKSETKTNGKQSRNDQSIRSGHNKIGSSGIIGMSVSNKHSSGLNQNSGNLQKKEESKNQVVNKPLIAMVSPSRDDDEGAEDDEDFDDDEDADDEYDDGEDDDLEGSVNGITSPDILSDH